MQEEKGENGTPHIQFCFSLRDKMRFSTLKNIFPKVHLEASKNWKDTIEYCRKSLTRCGRSISVPEKYVPTPPVHPLFKQIERVLIEQKVAPVRKIYWIVDKDGGMGKTTFVKYLRTVYPHLVEVSRENKSADIKMAYTGKFMFLCDFTRSKNAGEYAPWSALEEVKDGFINDSKLKKECREVIANPPWVFVFANEEPMLSTLTADKWCVIDRNDELFDF